MATAERSREGEDHGMDWTKQIEEMTKAWADAQSQVIEGWAAATAGAKVGGGVWQQTIDAWRTAVDGMLDSQAAWMARWTEAMPAGAPADVEAWARQARTMVEASIASQRQLWGVWFDTARRLDPSRGAMWSAADRDMLSGWQALARQMADMQAEWVRKWTTTP